MGKRVRVKRDGTYVITYRFGGEPTRWWRFRWWIIRRLMPWRRL